MTAFCVVWIGMHDVKPSLIKPRDCMQRWGILSFVHNNVLLRPGVSTRKQHWFKEKFIRAPTGIDTEQRGRRTLAAPSFHINKESWDRYRAPLLDVPPPHLSALTGAWQTQTTSLSVCAGHAVGYFSMSSSSAVLLRSRSACVRGCLMARITDPITLVQNGRNVTINRLLMGGNIATVTPQRRQRSGGQ